MNSEEEEQLSPSVKPKDPDLASPTGPTSALAPPSSPSLRPLLGSGVGHECSFSPTKKTKRASDPPLSASPLALPTSAVDPPSSTSVHLCPGAEDTTDAPTDAPAVEEYEDEYEDPFGGFELDTEAPPSTGPSEKKMAKRKAKQDKIKKKEEEEEEEMEPSDPESDPESSIPGVKLPAEVWEWPPHLSDKDELYTYLTMVLLEMPHAKNLRLDFFKVLSWNAELACTLFNAKEKEDVERDNALLDSALEHLRKMNGGGPTKIEYIDKPECCNPIKKILDSPSRLLILRSLLELLLKMRSPLELLLKMRNLLELLVLLNMRRLMEMVLKMPSNL